MSRSPVAHSESRLRHLHRAARRLTAVEPLAPLLERSGGSVEVTHAMICATGATPRADSPQPDQAINSHYGTSLAAQMQQLRILRGLDDNWPATGADGRLTHSTRG